MRDVIGQLHRWLARTCPAVLDALAPGLMQTALDLYQKDFGTPFPASLRELYGWRNGVAEGRTAPIVGRFEPVMLKRAARSMRDDVLPVFEHADDQLGWHVPTGHVIATLAGERTVIAPDFDAYLHAYVDSLEHGVWTYDAATGLDDRGQFAITLATRFPPSRFVVVPKPAPVAPTERAARPYAPSTTYAVGDRVAHPTFGIGTVRTVSATKVEIGFADGPRTLVHARR